MIGKKKSHNKSRDGTAGKVISGITGDLKSIPGKVKEKTGGLDLPHKAKMSVPYVIAGYYFDKVSFVFRHMKGSLGFADMIMVNPVIIQKSQPYDTEEGCLSLQGVRKTKRFRKIKVRYQDESFKDQTQEFEGHVAQIIQHEGIYC